MPIENMTQIESSLGLAEGTLQEAIASDDAIKIEIPQGKFIDTETHEVFTKKDLLKRDENLKEEFQRRGVEIAVKEARTKYELDFEGSRKGDGENIRLMIEAAKAKAIADAGAEPDAKIKELSTDLEKLKGINSEWESKYNSLVSESTAKDNQRRIDGNILESIQGDLTLTKSQLMTLFKSEYHVVEEDGKQLIKKGGETLKNDSNLEPLSLSDVMPKFLEPFVKQVEGGSGGGDSSGSGKEGTLEAFNKEMDKADKPQGSEAYNMEMMKRISDKTLAI